MQHIYMQSDEHLQVFTTVLSSQGEPWYKHEEAERMAVSHSYKPHWPDEHELLQGDVIQVVSKREEARWFGCLQSGQEGYFPKSCVMELSQGDEPARDLRRSLSGPHSAPDLVSWVRAGFASGHRLQAPRGGSKGEGPLEGARGQRQGSILVLRPQNQTQLPQAPKPPAPRAPGLLQRILSKPRRRSKNQGATNGAFEAD
ncbi:jouberin-like [Osmerus mordax]|uniref:jouberin-like n=1 Tax=Osmerus mordax TaxID=8014 RepID=UPI00350F8C93